MTSTITDRLQLNRIHAEAIRQLVNWTELDVALALGRATLTRIEHTVITAIGIGEAEIYLTVDPEARSLFEADSSFRSEGEYGVLREAFHSTANLSQYELVPKIHFAAPVAEVSPHQGTAREPGRYQYRGLRYRSKTETRVAEALDSANVLYFPLPLGVRHYQRIAEPDFLVVSMGRIGVLEIDGPHHTPLTRAQEAAKDAKLLQSGVRIVHHVGVSAVDRDVEAVVREFLALLKGPIL